MFIVDNYSLAVVMCFITMLCWGSWGNTQKLAGKNWRFELFYWDYVLGILFLALISAFTLGNYGTEGRSFLTDISQASVESIGNALLGGIIFNLANILLVAAMVIAGMSVAFPVGIGIALVLGVLVNYFAVPKGNAVLLFAGIALITIAILIDAFAYGKLKSSEKKVTSKGIILSVIAGILMALFYRFVASSMSNDFVTPETGKLTPYSAVVFFAIGILLSNFIFNTWLMKRPVEGLPVSYSDYFKGTFKEHFTGILGGIIWNIGMSMSIIASGKAGYAISYGLGQGATLIAALWGVFVWREFKNAPKGVNSLLAMMFLFFLAGLVLLIIAGS